MNIDATERSSYHDPIQNISDDLSHRISLTHHIKIPYASMLFDHERLAASYAPLVSMVEITIHHRWFYRWF